MRALWRFITISLTLPFVVTVMIASAANAQVLSINDVTMTEGDAEETIDVVLTISLDQVATSQVSVFVNTSDVTALAGEDYTAASGTVTIPAGQSAANFTVEIIGDNSDQSNETFTVNLSNPENAAIGDASGVVTIANDDNTGGPPFVSVNDVQINEADGNAVFDVTLTKAGTFNLTIDVTTADGTAQVLPGDYNAHAETITFLPGETQKTFTVPVNNDSDIESSETFFVNLNGGNVGVLDGQGVGTITDGDAQTGGPEAMLSATHIQFPTIPVGGKSIGVLTISSTGTTDLTVNNISGIDNSPYFKPPGEVTVIDPQQNETNISSDNFPVTVPPGHTLEVTATFTADQVGTFLDSIFVFTSDPARGQVKVELQGEAVTGIASVNTFKVDFEFLDVDQTDTQEVVFTNTGVAALTVTEVTGTDAGSPIQVLSVREQDENGAPVAGPAALNTSPFQPDFTLDAGHKLIFETRFAPVTGHEDMDFAQSMKIVATDGTEENTFLIDFCATTTLRARLQFSRAFARPDGQGIIGVTLDTPTPIAGIQFSVRASDRDGSGSTSPHATLLGVINNLESAGFTVSTGDPDQDGRTTVLVFDSGGGSIDPGDDIQILDLAYEIKNDAPHDLIIDLQVESIVLSDPNSQSVAALHEAGFLQIGKPGDVAGGTLNDGDGQVNILDIVRAIQYVLQTIPTPTDPFRFFVADANGDGDLNVLDIVFMVRSFLDSNQTVKTVAAAAPIEPVAVGLNNLEVLDDGRMVLPVTLDADGAVAAFQASFTFDPSQITLGTPQLTGHADQLTLQYEIVEGTLRLIAYSAEGRLMSAGTGHAVLIPVTLTDAQGTSTVTLTEVILADAQAGLINSHIEAGHMQVKTLPTTFALSNNRPNPFNPSTTIAYEVPQTAHITLTVYNLLGQEVVRLVDQVRQPGRYTVTWNGRNADHSGVASGIYLYRVTSSTGFVDTKRMTLLK